MKPDGLVSILALSVRQPHASDIASGAKSVEYRVWGTAYRGPLLIVSSRKPKVTGLPSGQALAVVELVFCERASDGIWHWGLRNAVAIEPFSVTGRLGLYEVEIRSSCLPSKTAK